MKLLQIMMLILAGFTATAFYLSIPKPQLLHCMVLQYNASYITAKTEARGEEPGLLYSARMLCVPVTKETPLR